MVLATICYYRRRILAGPLDALTLGVLPLGAAVFLAWGLAWSVQAAPASQNWSLAGVMAAGVILMAVARFGLRSAFKPQTSAHGQWLRDQRQARGWNIQQMARKLREAAKAAGDIAPQSECLATMIRRWEKGGGVSERYQLHYCRAFQIPPHHFGSTPAADAAPGESAAKSTARDREPATVVLIIVVPASGRPATPADDST